MIDFESIRHTHLAEPEWLHANLHTDSLRIVDMSGTVMVQTEPDGFQSAQYLGMHESYLVDHIPGAVYLDWTTDLVDLTDPVTAQVAPPAKIAEVLGKAGISNDTMVVAYDSHPSSQFATRLWWLLRYYGHQNCMILNGGFTRWKSLGLPTEGGTVTAPPALFVPTVNANLRATATETAEKIGRPGERIIDARDEGQYSGRIRRGPRGGHIPGAVNIPREALVNGDGTYKPTGELKSMFAGEGITEADTVTAYCNGGVAATSVLFALSLTGHDKICNYDGSWNEWTNRHDLPVATT